MQGASPERPRNLRLVQVLGSNSSKARLVRSPVEQSRRHRCWQEYDAWCVRAARLSLCCPQVQ
eukprot:6409464-Amphidinium_carterae.1